MNQFPKFDFSAFERKLSIKLQLKTLDTLGALDDNVIDFNKYLSSLNEEEKMAFEERAAIMEFDGLLSRDAAEKNAFDNVISLRNYKNGK